MNNGRGIRRQLVDGQDYVNGPAWYRAWETKEVIGTCRHAGCDGLMTAVPNHTAGTTDAVWYGAQCLSCGGEVAVRGDRPLLPGTTRRGGMRPGAWELREKRMRALVAKEDS